MDDIVTILREIAKRGVGRTVDNAGNCIPTRAADEIERLRKRVAYLESPCPRCDYEEPND